MTMMKKRFHTALLLMSLSAVPLSSAWALSGKTMCHYVAYDVAFWPKNMPVTAANFPKLRLDSMAKLPVDTIVFAPTLGFGSMAANLRNSAPIVHQPAADSVWMRSYKNGMGEMLKSDWDTISETVKWCRAKKKEAVVALPVNLMIHGAKPDAKRSPGSWYSYLWPQFKSENPGCLMAGADGKGPGGMNVDYSEAKVRDKFAAIAIEIAGKYDLDGIMVDFMMYPTLFKSVAAGGTAAPKEVEQLTQMMAKIAAACKAASARLGHKVAFGARVPDSAGYCQAIGIGLQSWFDSKMLDFVVLGGDFQLNRWSAAGELAAKAGIPYYASFCASGIYVGNDSGYTGDDERLPRQAKPTFCARIADALLCKASGCMYSFGMHHQHSIPLSAVAPFDAAANRLADKRYFVSYTNDRAARNYLKDDAKFHGLPSLISSAPVDLSGGLTKQKVEVWDDVAALKKGGADAKATLITEASLPSGVDTVVTFNGKELKPFKKRAGTQLYDIPTMLVKYGANEVTLKTKGKNRRGQTARLGNVAVEISFPPAAAKEASK